ncbi:MAG: carbon-nitrogen hydrolase family protein [Candidatus Omnitrophica bacterium]|nr:carbon-nitrogen hydrolase family protein [Candidatus Omnitrophota bacterium]
MLKIALIQMNAGLDKQKNMEKAVFFVNQAIRHQARFILLPEVFVFRGPMTHANLRQVMEPIPGDTTRIFMALARKYRVHILLGSIYEKSPTPSKAYNTSVLINDRGKIAGTYRKQHLFEAVLGKQQIKESRYFLAGNTATVRTVCGFKVGLSVCFDVRFPRLYQTYKKQNVEIICIPSAFAQKTGQSHFEVLVRARAIEGLCYVLAPDQVGSDYNGGRMYGKSLVVDPWGKILVQGSASKEEILYAHLDKKIISDKRTILSTVLKKE